MSRAEEARALLAQALDVSAEALGAAPEIGLTPQWDSIAHMRLVLALEAKLGRRLGPEAIVSISSLDDVAELMAAESAA